MFVIITGGSKGLGKALVELFLSKGFNVITCGRNAAALEQLSADMQALYPNPKLLTQSADLSKTSDTQKFAQFVLKNCDKIEILINNLLPQFIAQQSGHIFNICSVASSTILDNCTAYTISKHALLGFSHSLRHELKQHQVKVTTVVPGAIYTSSWDGVPVNPDRLMPTQDVAQAVADCYQLSKRTVVEDIVLRPMLGDL